MNNVKVYVIKKRATFSLVKIVRIGAYRYWNISPLKRTVYADLEETPYKQYTRGN